MLSTRTWMQVQGYSLFPGQIIAVEGIVTQMRGSVGGEKAIKVFRIVEGLPLPLTDRSTAPGPGVRAMVAAGPYTTKDSLEYVPLDELIAVAAQEKPDILILCGPFVDANQSGIKDSKLINMTYEEVFFDRVVGKLNRL